jgi:hypothetical protein
LHLFANLEFALDAVLAALKPGGRFISKTPCLAEMNPIIPSAAVCAVGLCFWHLTVAQSALVHEQGDEGQREAYYVDFPVDLTHTPKSDTEVAAAMGALLISWPPRSPVRLTVPRH